jgi:hypothetical protein
LADASQRGDDLLARQPDERVNAEEEIAAPHAAQAQPVAERLGLRVQPQARSGARPEQSSDEEVDRAEVGRSSRETSSSRVSGRSVDAH